MQIRFAPKHDNKKNYDNVVLSLKTLQVKQQQYYVIREVWYFEDIIVSFHLCKCKKNILKRSLKYYCGYINFKIDMTTLETSKKTKIKWDDAFFNENQPVRTMFCMAEYYKLYELSERKQTIDEFNF